MEPFERFKSRITFFSNAMEKVCGLIKEWKPIDCKSEKDFEESLLQYLEQNLPGIEIIKQYGIGINKIDIVVGDEVFIEIKKDFTNVNQLKRLIGQLVLYKRENINNLIILICGQYEKSLTNKLEKEMHDLWDALLEESELILK